MAERKVFCVLVTYNAARWVDNVLKQLARSSVKMGIIIIDNGSTDGTQSIISSSEIEVDFVQAERNLGFGKGNNIGIKRAYGQGADFVFLLNQDAWPEENAVKYMVDASERHPEYGILSPVHLDGTGLALDFNFSRYVSPMECHGFFSDGFLNQLKEEPYELPFVNAAAWLVTRNCIETVGGFSSTFFHYSEDDNYCQRVLFHGLKIGIVSKALICHDRQNVTKNTYFTDYHKRIKRGLALEYSNPNANYTVFKMIRNSCVLIMKDLMMAVTRLDVRRLQMFKSRVGILFSTQYSQIVRNRTLSRTKGLHFLD